MREAKCFKNRRCTFSEQFVLSILDVRYPCVSTGTTTQVNRYNKYDKDYGIGIMHDLCVTLFAM